MPFALLMHGLSRRRRVARQLPATPDLKKSYDVVIIGGGGHGLAAAYYLATRHGITDVVVLEKSWRPSLMTTWRSPSWDRSPSNTPRIHEGISS